ncbi:LuxR family transcriptional regulator [Lentzea sp. HUAS12]|uniref:helix-turn-helix transcriptional regulator n=1 Tax=Lentzea sp. HUAS12 TaxID=2951806 RepID=UPI00209D07B0|nr:LuxR family transcriptional regulator [Lentzea sp. HUAS12]USX49484.1 LuxR C-terminal-related transcriptional regulator [Lentzea sp. HUAS12]
MTTRDRLVLDAPVRGVLDRINDADAGTRLRVVVAAPGGYGKTALLSEITNTAVRVVDDAHLLDDASLRALAAEPLLVLAHRPWPRRAALAELTHGAVVVPLAPLTRDQVRELLNAGKPVADFVYAQTLGVPRFVERLGATSEVSADALAAFRAELDWLDPDLQKFLIAAEAGAGQRLDLLSALLDKDFDEVSDIIEAARATGMLAEDGTLLPLALRAVGSLTRTERRIAVRQKLAQLQLDRGGPVLDLVRPLLDTGIGGPVFVAAAREALSSDPALAAGLFKASTGGGTPSAETAASWATASAMAGDLDGALRLADLVISAPDSPHRRTAAEVAAVALAHRGQLARSTELFRWAATPYAAAFAGIGLIGTGHLFEETPPQPPTMLGGAASLMLQGVRQSVAGAETAALSTLVRASSMLEPAGGAVLLPDSPAALAALVALHCGEPNVAESVLDRAVENGTGGVLMSVRHRLLQAWLHMLRGNLAVARETLLSVRGAFEPRDWIFAVALEVGVARRNSDLATLRRTWEQACEAVLRHPVDLFSLLPLGEFAAAAARLRDQERLAPHLAQASALLRSLGNPPLWAAQIHWGLLHAAIIDENSAAAEEHAAALAACRDSSRYCLILSGAAECWLDVVAGKVDADRVEEAARSLHAVGLWWDASRLAGQAAIRTSDRQAMVRLLDCARLLQGRPVSARRASEAADVVPVAEDAGKLSDREREVAQLVLEGMTYRQVGDRLFISAKTVEHHMARMRQRLGSTSRSDLLGQLRHILGA